jgi:hypothetical protein
MNGLMQNQCGRFYRGGEPHVVVVPRVIEMGWKVDEDQVKQLEHDPLDWIEVRISKSVDRTAVCTM